MSNEPRIAAAYIRCSTAEQDDSPETQRHVISTWCAANGYVVPEDCWYVDVGVSSENYMPKRPAGARLLSQVVSKKTRPWNEILVVRLSRVFRDIYDQESTFQLLDKHRIEIVGVTESLSRKTPMEKGMVAIRGVFNMMQRLETGVQIKEKNTTRHQKGLHTHGNPPLGLTVGASSNDPLRIVPEKLVRAIRVFEVYADTCGNLRETARRLNAEGVLPARSLRWTAVMVRNCVTRPAYRRMAYYDGDMRAKPDIIPETIPPELLERVNAILISQYGKWHVRFGDGMHTRADKTYTGLLACARCGGPMDMVAWRGGVGVRGEPITADNTAFRCREKTHVSSKCDMPRLHGPTLDRLVGECILRELTRLALGNVAPTSRAKRKAAPRPIEERLAELAEQRSRALVLYVKGRDAGGISAEEWEAISGKIDADVAALKRVAAEVASGEISVPSIPLDTIQSLLDHWLRIWTPSFDSPRKREFLTTVLGVGRGGIVCDKRKYASGTTKNTWTLRVTAAKLGGELPPYEWTGHIPRGNRWVTVGNEESDS